MFYNDNGIPRELKVKILPNIFIAKYKETSYNDIVNAHNEGKIVIAIRDEYQYQLYAIRSSECEFGSVYDLTVKTLIVDVDNNWSNSSQSLQKNLIFNTEYNKDTNKVATMLDIKNNILYGTSEPTSSQGENGNIYIQIEE